VRARGRGGHGSGLNPGSAPHELIAGLSRLLELPPRYHVTAPARRYFEALAPLHNEHWRAIFLDLDRAIAPDGPTVGLMPGMANWFLDTVQVTVLDAGEQINVIPEAATARIDVRLLPDSDAEAFLARLREALGPELEVEVLLTAPPAPASPTDNAFYRAIEAVLGREGPVVPAFIPGFTDSRYFRARGIPAYGLSPFALQGPDLRGIHGPDERIPVAEFEAGVARTIRAVSRAISPAP
ncbi:MAG: M20/M25/M40 family metallo-hydrolase, partial [Candidatus Rokuibacteriota bacterium]